MILPGNPNIRKRLNEIYQKHTGQAIKKIEDALAARPLLHREAARLGLVER